MAVFENSASAFASGEVIDHHVADHRAITATQCRVGEVAAEKGAEGVAVGKTEHAERADHHMDVDGVRVTVKDPVRMALRQDLGDELDHRGVHADDGRGTPDVLGLVDVLDPDQLDEVRVGVVVVEGDLRQAADGRDRIEVIELDVLLGLPDLGIGKL